VDEHVAGGVAMMLADLIAPLPVKAARAVYRGYVHGGRRAGQVRRLHVIRDTPVAHHGDRACWPRAEYTWCGQSAGLHQKSAPQVISPLPDRPPEGLAWCPACIGHLAEYYGLLGEVAASLAAYDPGLGS